MVFLFIYNYLGEVNHLLHMLPYVWRKEQIRRNYYTSIKQKG